MTVYVINATTLCQPQYDVVSAHTECHGVYTDIDKAKVALRKSADELRVQAENYEDNPEDNARVIDTFYEGVVSDTEIYLEYENSYDDYIQVSVEIVEVEMED